MAITPQEIAETRGMVAEQNLDIRTITMGISLMSCADESLERMATKVYDHVTHTAEHLVETAENLEREYGIPIVNKRIAVTPVAQIAAACHDEDLTPLAHALDRAAETLGIDYLGGFSALVHKGIGDADRRLMNCIPEALAATSRVCSSVNVASLRAGINMDAVLKVAELVRRSAELTADQDSVGASKFVVFANMVEDSPFMAGAVHGSGEADAVINVGVSGPGVMAAALEELSETASMMEVAEKIKQTAFKITRAGELMSREASSTCRSRPRPPSATRWRVSWRSSASARAAARGPRRRSRCSTTASRRAASWPPRASAACRARSSRYPRTPA